MAVDRLDVLGRAPKTLVVWLKPQTRVYVVYEPGDSPPPGDGWERIEYVPYTAVAGAVARADVLAAIDKIEREEYVNGLRCSDFKEALDAVRAALGGQSETPPAVDEEGRSDA